MGWLLGKAPLGQGQGGGVGAYGAQPVAGTLVGVTWATDGNGRGYNTPAVGSELLTNGSMEAGSPPSSWTGAGAGLSIASVTDERTGGAGTKALAATYSANAQRVYQQFTATTAQWVQVRFWAKKMSGPLDTFIFQIREANVSGVLTVEVGEITLTSEWQEFVMAARCFTANPFVVFRSPNGLVSPQVVRVDDVSVEPLTLASLFATVDAGVANATPRANVWSNEFNDDYRVPAGAVANLDDPGAPANFVLAYHDTVVFRATKCVAGVYTSLVAEATAYVQGAAVEIRNPSTNTYRFYYNGAQVGTDQTVSDAGIVSNTHYGAFSTYSGVKISRFTVNSKAYAFPA
jgi:hypothetical protein